MIYYHGTTQSRAEKICTEGFKPRKPSRRVWFTRGKGYALRRARTQARRAHDQPVVLTCDLDLSRLRRESGYKRFVTGSGGIVAINGPVPVTVLRSHPAQGAVPCSPEELNEWVCRLLNIKIWKGPGRKHPGINRLSRWIANRLTSEPTRAIHVFELATMARQWLPEFFEGFRIDTDTLVVHPHYGQIKVRMEPPAEQVDPREEQALQCLDDTRPKHRIRGLSLLAQLGDPDLFDWCAMLLEDESESVRVSVLKTIAEDCEEAELSVVEPFVSSTDIHTRGAAIACLCSHGGDEASRWFERGLKDPSSYVRLQAAGHLNQLDATLHRHIFELALTDPNSQIVNKARRLTAHKHYAPIRW